jgi:hypothetical protein
MDCSNFSTQSGINESMPRERRFLFKLWGDYYRLKHLTAATSLSQPNLHRVHRIGLK